MAPLTITDNRTIYNEADAITTWTGWNTSPQAYTTDPDPIEAAGSIGYGISNENAGAAYLANTSLDLSDTLVYVWGILGGVMDTTTNGGGQIVFTTFAATVHNAVGYHLVGSDLAAFRHEDDAVTWQCMLIDGSLLPTANTTHAGSHGSFSISDVDGIGVGFKTLAKTIGGGENCWNEGEPTKQHTG